MATTPKPSSRNGFQIALICALPVESDAVMALFDEVYEDDSESYGKAPGDPNTYTTGRIGRHPVVLAYLPGMGKNAAASVSATFLTSFPNIKLGLVVGICGVAPVDKDDEDIVLGDVIISDEIVQYDFGRQYAERFIRKDTLNESLGRQTTEIRGFLHKLKGTYYRTKLEEKVQQYSKDISAKKGYAKFKYPGPGTDRLYPSEFRHQHRDGRCEICAKCKSDRDPVCAAVPKLSCESLGCNKEKKELPRRQPSDANEGEPMIHIGKIACGDRVIKSAVDRDLLIEEEEVIAFEMEGAGTWDNLPTIVVKSACDYADSHKQKDWQKYAAATAASCMKACLEVWRLSDAVGEVAQASSSSRPSDKDDDDDPPSRKTGSGRVNATFGKATALGNGKINQIAELNTTNFSF